MDPAGRGQGVAVGADIAVIDRVADGVAPRQRPPGRVTGPDAEAVVVAPVADAAVAGRVVGLPDGLRPGPAPGVGVDRGQPPGVGAGIGQDGVGLIGPVLAPVFDDHGLAAVLHDQDMLQADVAAVVRDQAHDLVAARQFRRQRVIAGQEADHFAHVEPDAEFAGLGQDRLAVAGEGGRGGGGAGGGGLRGLGQGGGGQGGEQGGGEQQAAHRRSLLQGSGRQGWGGAHSRTARDRPTLRPGWV